MAKSAKKQAQKPVEQAEQTKADNLPEQAPKQAQKPVLRKLAKFQGVKQK